MVSINTLSRYPSLLTPLFSTISGSQQSGLNSIITSFYQGSTIKIKSDNVTLELGLPVPVNINASSDINAVLKIFSNIQKGLVINILA